MPSAQHKKPLDTLLVDLDGTLLDVKARLYACYYDILSQVGATPLALEDYWSLKRAKAPFAEQIKGTGYSANDSAFWTEWMRRIEHPDYLAYDTLKPRAIETLRHANNYSHSIILVTMRKHRENLERQLDKLQLTPLLTEIIDAPVSKLTALQGRNFGRALLIGDTEEDMETAKRLSIVSIALTNGLRKRDLLAGDYYYEEISDIEWSLILECPT